MLFCFCLFVCFSLFFSFFFKYYFASLLCISLSSPLLLFTFTFCYCLPFFSFSFFLSFFFNVYIYIFFASLLSLSLSSSLLLFTFSVCYCLPFFFFYVNAFKLHPSKQTSLNNIVYPRPAFIPGLSFYFTHFTLSFFFHIHTAGFPSCVAT